MYFLIVYALILINFSGNNIGKAGNELVFNLK